MTDNSNASSGMGGFGFGRFNQLGATLRQSAQEISAKAAAQINEVNAKIAQQQPVLQRQSQHGPTTTTSGEGVLIDLTVDGETTVTTTTNAVSTAQSDTSTVASNNGATVVALPPASSDASRKDLTDMMQKMNKKLKLLTHIKQQLTEKVEKTEKEKSQLRSLVVDEILNGGVDVVDGQDEYIQLREAWRRADEQNNLSLQQLQLEFKKLQSQQQQSMNGDSTGASAQAESWEKEKQSIIQHYETQVVQLKEELNKKVEEVNTMVSDRGIGSNPVPTPIENTSSAVTANHDNEILKVKEAAAAQIQAFKQKVAKARSEDLTRIKAEMKEQAQVLVEQKSAELKQQYENQLAQLTQQYATEKTAQQDEHERVILILKEQNNSEIQKMRAELEQSKDSGVQQIRRQLEQDMSAQLDERVQAAVTELQAKHLKDVQQLKEDADRRIFDANRIAAEELQSATRQAQQKTEAMQAEFDQSKRTLDDTIQSLQEQMLSARKTVYEEIEHLKQQLHAAETAATTATSNALAANQDLIAAKEAEIEKLKIVFESERDNLQKLSAQEKETMRLDFQQKYQQAIQKIQADANNFKDEAIKKVRDDMAAKFEGAKRTIEELKLAELQKITTDLESSKNEAVRLVEERNVTTMQQVQNEWTQQRNDLQKQLDDSTKEYKIKVQQEQALQLELQKVQSLLTSLQQSSSTDAQTVNKALEDALGEQRILYEGRIKQDEDRYQQQISTLQTELEETRKAHDAVSAEADTVRESLNEISQIRDQMKRQLDEMVAQSERERVERMQQMELQANDVKKQLEAFHLELQQKEAALKTASATLSEKELELVTLRQQYEAKSIGDMDQLQKTSDEAIANLTNQLRSKEEEIVKLLSAKDEAEKMNIDFQSKQQNLQSTYEGEIERLRSEATSATALYNEAQKMHEKLISELNESKTSSNEKDHAEVRQKLIDEKDAEMAEMKQKYDEKLAEAAKKEATVAQTFNKVKAAYTQKLQKVEKEMNDKIESLTKEKDSLVEGIQKTKEVYETEKQKLENEIRDIRASFEANISDTKSEKDRAVADLSMKLKVAEDDAKIHQDAISKLEQDINILKDQLAGASDNSNLDEMQKEMEEKIQQIESEHAEHLKKIQIGHEEELIVLREAKEALKAKADFADALEKQKEELTSKLEAQIRKHEEDTANLRKTMETHVDKMTEQFKEKLESARKQAETEATTLQNSIKERDSKLGTLVAKLKALTASSTKLRDENETMKKKAEMDGQTQGELRAKIDALKKQLEDSEANSSATAGSLLQEQEKLQTEKSQLSNQIKSLQGTIQARNNKIEELSGKLSALTSNLNALTEERKEQNEKLERASKLEQRLKASESEATDLRDQINKLKLERQKNMTLVERLQAEKETSERNHGQRTALVGMLESQLSQLNDKNAEINAKFEAALYDLSQKDEMIEAVEERVRKLEIELEEAHATSKKANESLVALQKSGESKTSKHVESLQTELQNTKQQMARKSAAAQRLIQQREAECAELRNANRALQQEVDKGSYGERRIFELAAKQSNRETLQLSEIDARDSIIERLKQALVDRDDDLASAEKHAREVETQLEDLFRIRRREDVNIDYLKSIVVKYLSLPAGSDERARLLPVLATLLQFDDNDYKIIDEGKSKVSWWGSSVIPTLISAPAISAVSTSVTASALSSQSARQGT